MTKSEKGPIFGIFSPKTILMFRVGAKKLGQVGNRNHTYISFKPKEKHDAVVVDCLMSPQLAFVW